MTHNMTSYEPVFFDIETTGFNPMAQEWYDHVQHDARVTAVGIGTIQGWDKNSSHESCQYDVKVLWDDSEYRLLEVAADRMIGKTGRIKSDGKEPFLVSFNGRQFDHPYMGARCSRFRLDGYPYTHGVKRLDMMRALGKHFEGVGRYPSEDDCLEAVGIESDDPYDGSDMPDAFANKEWDKIKEHVRKDVLEMMKLFVETRDECITEFKNHYDEVPEVVVSPEL